MGGYKTAFIFNLIICHCCFSQTDTISRHLMVDPITVKAYRQSQTIKQLSDIHNTYIIGGRKNEVLDIAGLPANISETPFANSVAFISVTP